MASGRLNPMEQTMAKSCVIWRPTYKHERCGLWAKGNTQGTGYGHRLFISTRKIRNARLSCGMNVWNLVITKLSPEGGTEKGPFLFAYALRTSNTHITEARWGSMPGLSGNSGAQGGFALGPVSSAPGGNSRTIELFNASRRPSSSLR